MHDALSIELQVRVCAFLDLRALLRLRRCSRGYHLLSATSMVDDLHRIVKPFVPHPSQFLQALKTTHAFIGGEGAASFLLRLTTPLPSFLEVYVPDYKYPRLIHHLLYVQGASRIPCPLLKNAPPFWLPLHGLYTVVTMQTTRGDIYIYRSASNDPLLPICRAPLTPYVSYVNPDYFGTAYPSLLFRRRALLGDGSQDDINDTEHLLQLGFDVRLTAQVWHEHRAIPCPAAAWLCTAQVRRFTDAGSLACRTLPLVTKRLKSVAVWRVDVRPCGGTCLMDSGGVLEDWQLFDYA